MKHSLVIGLFFWTIVSCNTIESKQETNRKEFEGTITYKTILESKKSYVSTEDMQSLFGDTMVLSIKQGKYKMTFNGNDVKEILYLNDKNNQYTIRNGIDTLYVGSCDNETNPLVSSEIQKQTETILNRQCKELINNLGSIKYHYWFDSDLYINPDHFKKHKFGYVNKFYEMTKSIWLKYFYEGKSYNITYTAIKINETNLADSDFKLPNFPQGKLE